MFNYTNIYFLFHRRMLLYLFSQSPCLETIVFDFFCTFSRVKSSTWFNIHLFFQWIAVRILETKLKHSKIIYKSLSCPTVCLSACIVFFFFCFVNFEIVKLMSSIVYSVFCIHIYTLNSNKWTFYFYCRKEIQSSWNKLYSYSN